MFDQTTQQPLSAAAPPASSGCTESPFLQRHWTLSCPTPPAGRSPLCRLQSQMVDLRSVYAAVDEPAALDALDAFSTRWDTKYPKISRSWRENWANLSTYFKYPQEVRRLIYTTNSIEGFNRQLRKVTKTRSVFPTDDSLFKMLYLEMVDITKKWTGRQRD